MNRQHHSRRLYKLYLVLCLCMNSGWLFGQWKSVSLPGQSYFPELLVKGTRLYVFHGESSGFEPIIYTDNFGQSWKSLDQFQWYYGFVNSGNAYMYLYAADTAGTTALWRTSGNGSNWQALANPPKNYSGQNISNAMAANGFSVHLGTGGLGFQGGKNFLNSYDGGEHWEYETSGLDSTIYDRDIADMCIVNGIIYALIVRYSDAAWIGIYSSTDQGITWTRNTGVTEGEKFFPCQSHVYFYSWVSQTLYVNQGANSWAVFHGPWDGYKVDEVFEYGGDKLVAWQNWNTEHFVSYQRFGDTTWTDWNEGHHRIEGELAVVGPYMFAVGQDTLWKRSLSQLDSSAIPTTGTDPFLSGGDAEEDLSAWLGNTSGDLEAPLDFGQPGQCALFGTPKYMIQSSGLSLFISDYLFKGPAFGPVVKCRMVYNPAHPDSSKEFGRRWKLSMDWKIVPNKWFALLTKGNGRLLKFNSTAAIQPGMSLPLALNAPDGVHDSLSYDGTYWYYFEKSSTLTYVLKQQADSTARLSRINDRNGNSIQLQYDGSGRIISITDAANRAITLQYGSNGLCSAMQLPDGRIATFSYNTNQLLSSVTDLAGLQTDYTYDNKERIKAMTVDSRTTYFGYAKNTGERLSWLETPDDRYFYFQLQMTDSVYGTSLISLPGGGSRIYTHENGITKSVTNEEGQTRYLNYNANLERVSASDYSGNWWAYQYDARGNIVRETRPDGSIIHLSYDQSDNLTNIVRPLGYSASFVYDSKGNQIQRTNAAGQHFYYTYDSKGRMLSSTSPSGIQHSFNWTSLGNLQSVVSGGGTFSFNYDSYGYHVKSASWPNGAVYHYQFDNNDRLIQITDPMGNSMAYYYNCCTQSSYTDANNHTWIVNRDAGLHLSAFTDPSGNTFKYTYDQNGNLSGVKSPVAQIYSKQYSASGNILSETDALHNRWNFQYNPDASLKQIAGPKQDTITLLYDTYGRYIGTTDPLGNSISSLLDSLGRISTLINARGQQTTFHYNLNNLLTQIDYSGNPIFFYQWDHENRMVQSTDPEGTTNFNYTTEGYVSRIDYPDLKYAVFEYDGNGNLIKITYPDGFKVSNQFNDRNQVKAVNWLLDSLAISYDPGMRVTDYVRSNGVNTSYEWTNRNEIERILHLKGMDTLASFTYSFNAEGSIRSMKKSIPAFGIPAEKHDTYLYDKAGHLLQAGQNYYSWDADGNLISRTGSDPLTANYDPQNRMLTMNASQLNLEVNYDALGRRRKIIRNTNASIYYWGPKGRLLAIGNISGQINWYFIYRGMQLIAVSDGTNSWFYHFDKTGNTYLLTDQSGQLANYYDYDAWGNILQRSESFYQPFLYCGAYGVMEESKNLYFMKNRYYDSNTGRFIQKDPAGIIAGLNFYRYVVNNPVSGIDPNGLGNGKADGTIEINDPGYDSGNNIGAGTVDIGDKSFQGLNPPSNWDTYLDIADETLNKTTDHPIFDLFGDVVNAPIQVKKTIDALRKGDYKNAVWQWVPFNNTMSWLYNELGKPVSNDYDPNAVYTPDAILHQCKR